MDHLHALIEGASYMAHGYCLLWQPWLVTLYAGSDLLIFLSYLAIPGALLAVLRRRPELRFGFVVALFAAFILLCGITHALSVITLWFPIYPVVGVVKLATGLVSATTALVLFRLIPMLLRVPTPDQLQDAIKRLEAEAEAHRATLEALRTTQAGLEGKVAERTAELEASNQRLSVIMHEALHRSRNLLATVGVIARQTARATPEPAAFLRAFTGRLDALATVITTLGDHPGGAGEALDLRELVEDQLALVSETFGERITIDGPEIELHSEPAKQFALALHELATNAMKYGALGAEGGHIDIRWRRAAGKTLVFEWIEQAGERATPAVEAPSSGFGSALLKTIVPGTLEGVAEHRIGPDSLTYRLEVPLRRLLTRARTHAATADAPAAGGAPLAGATP